LRHRVNVIVLQLVIFTFAKVYRNHAIIVCGRFAFWTLTS